MKKLLLAILLCIASQSQAQLLDDLVAYWKLDEASGNAVDAHASNDLTDNNTVPSTTGKLNNGRSSTAANSEKLSIADNADLSFGDEDFTIAFWWQRGAVSTNAPILGKWDIGVAADHEYHVYQQGNKVRFLVSNNGTAATGDLTSDDVPSGVAYAHIVCYHDAANNEIGIIIDNGTPKTLSYSGGCRDGTHAFEVCGSNSTYHTIVGIDEIGVWNRVLTSGEITSLYNSGSGLSYDSFTASSTGNPLLLQLLLTSIVFTISLAYFHRRRGQ